VLVGLAALMLASPRAWAAYSSGGEETVAAQDDFFDPDAVHVSVGTTIEWMNTGRNPHTVTADDGSKDSGNLRPGQSFSITFPGPGVFAYFCRYHGAAGGIGMAGVILVGNALLPSRSGVRVGPGREPVPAAAGATRAVPPPPSRARSMQPSRAI
jgi:plastocyanin